MSKCAICRAEFTRKYMSTKTCGDPICKAELKRQIARKKAEKEDTRIRKEKIKSLRDWLDDVQKVFNAYIRARDGNVCISCGTQSPGIQYCAGHYRSRGAAPQHRFNEINVHSQCNRRCNMMMSGNIVNYRPALIAKIGLAAVEALENDNEVRHYAIDELIELKARYKAKLKDISEKKAKD